MSDEAKERFTVNLPRETIKKIRAAAYWSRRTLSDLVEEALTREVDRLEKKQGEPFEVGKVKLSPGRPVRKPG